MKGRNRSSGAWPILAFLHIQKTAGTTFSVLLRRHFGLRHLDVRPVRGWLYMPEQFEADMNLAPYRRIESIAGHWCRPFIDYRNNADRLVWYTFLRDPVERYISHYQHLVEKLKRPLSFEDFLNAPIQRNWQVQSIAGGQDVETAKRMLGEKFRFVGLCERFDESLLLLRMRLQIPAFDVVYGERKNTSNSGTIRRSIRGELERWERTIRENNALDLELYDYARTTLYPRQVSEYGAEQLAADLAQTQRLEAHYVARLREIRADMARRYYYRPVVALRKLMPAWQSMENLRL